MKYDFYKVDLHCHLDGSIPLQTAYKLAQERNIKLPGITLDGFKQFLYDTSNCESLEQYLERFTLTLSLLQDYESLKETTYALLKDKHEKNVIYVEIRFAPQLNTQKELSQQDAVQAVIDGKNQAEKEFGIKSGIILCMMNYGDFTDMSANKKTIEMTKHFLNKGVCAIDLAGAEGAKPFSEYQELFDLIDLYNLPRTVHAGESKDYNSVNAAFKYVRNRIGHGIGCYPDVDTIAHLLENDIALEICLTSNIQCKCAPTYELHPLKKLYDLNVLVTINTDNELLANTDLDKEYDLAIEHLGFRKEDIIKMNFNSLKVAFVDEDTRKCLLKKMISKLVK